MTYRPRRPLVEATPVTREIKASATNAVRVAFREAFKRLEPLLGERWIGAMARLRFSAPSTFATIESAESQVNAIALRFMRGEALEQHFRDALALYEAAVRSAAPALRLYADTQEGVTCGACGRVRLVTLTTEDGERWCGTCWRRN